VRIHPLRTLAATLLLAISSAPGASAALLPRATFAHVPAVHRSLASGKIQHVVFVIQENRSFNYLFKGFPGALTQNYGLDANGKKIPLHAETLATNWDIDHSLAAFLAAYDDGKMDGWNAEPSCCGAVPKNFAYAYAPRSEIMPYWTMAKQYVLADHMFQSNLDGSFVAHQYAIAAYANHTVNFTTGPWGCGGGPSDQVATITKTRTIGPSVRPCFDNQTLGDEADAAGVSWRYYADHKDASAFIWSAYQAIRHIYHGPDWKRDVVSPSAQFLTDVAGGKLAQITWITPAINASDHAGFGFDSLLGPPWVASVVNAVGDSTFWNSTAIFIIWDDWGGWYDPVAPAYADYDGLGFRIPLLIVSPYAKKHFVSHVPYETSSVLRFMEDTFGLPQLAASDARANDPANDAFDFTAPPRAFHEIPGGQSSAFWSMEGSMTPRVPMNGSPAGGD
jgi:phospholipase C